MSSVSANQYRRVVNISGSQLQLQPQLSDLSWDETSMFEIAGLDDDDDNEQHCIFRNPLPACEGFVQSDAGRLHHDVSQNKSTLL